MKNRFYITYIIAAAALWGILGIFVRELSERNFTSLDIVSMRSIGAAIFFLAYLILFDREKMKIKIKDLWVFLGSGILSIVFFNFCYFYAMQIMSLSVAAALLYTAPAFVIILAHIILREKIYPLQYISILTAVIGCALVSGIAGTSVSITPFGFMIGLGAGLGYALYSIFGKIAIKKGYSSITITFYTFLISGISTFPFLHKEIILQNIEDVPFWNAVVLMVFLSTVLAYLSYTKGLIEVDAGFAAILSCFEPVVASIISTFVYSEKMSLTEWVGIILVIISACLSGCISLKKGGSE